jgi:transposase
MTDLGPKSDLPSAIDNVRIAPDCVAKRRLREAANRDSVVLRQSSSVQRMMGRRKDGQGQFFYAFALDEVVPRDHLVRQIDGILDLSWLHKELAAYYSHTGRPSIDPVLMIRMLIVGYVFAIRSERRLCSEVQVNLAYRWFCKLGIEDEIPDHSVFCRARNPQNRARSRILHKIYQGRASSKHQICCPRS